MSEKKFPSNNVLFWLIVFYGVPCLFKTNWEAHRIINELKQPCTEQTK